MWSLLHMKYFQFLEHSHQESFLSACRLALYKHEELVPTVKDLNELKPIPVPEAGDLPLLDLGSENFETQSLKFPLRSRRIRAGSFFLRGYRMIAMVRDGEVVADVWYATCLNATTPTIHPHVEWFKIKLNEDEAYFFDMHVYADHRGGGMNTYFHHKVLAEMRDRGYRKAYGCFVADNTPALWMHRLIGYRELPRCTVRRILLYESARAKN
ncbi:MAG: hypothetical protein IH614_04235 [Desulfuromonadales bacterium]|nr:hypothetical protein [Desulfuromonadales bacterium]